MSRVLVAGIGNIFLTDDGFGVEVINRLDRSQLPDDVDVADFGIRGVHLAYELLDDRYDTLIMVDALPLDGPPGTLAVLDATEAAARTGASTVDAHSMSPDVVLRTLHGLGGHIDRVLVVGCRPQETYAGIALSPPVAAAVDRALPVLTELIHEVIQTEARELPVRQRRAMNTGSGGGARSWTPSNC